MIITMLESALNASYVLHDTWNLQGSH